MSGKSKKKQRSRKRRIRTGAIYAGVFFVFLALGLIFRNNALGIVSLGAAAAALVFAVNTWFRLVGKTLRNVIGAVLVAAAAACVMLFFVGVDGRLFDADTRVITTEDMEGLDSLSGVGRMQYLERAELQNAGLIQLEELQGCSQLRYADLRGNSVDLDTALLLHQALPECEFLWDVELSCGQTAHDAADIVLTAEDAATEAEVEACLGLFDELTTVDLSGIQLSSEEYGRIRTAHPQIDFKWSAQLGTVNVGTEATELTLDEWVAMDDLILALGNLERIEMVDLSGVEYPVSDLKKLTDAFPGITLYWKTDISGADMSSGDVSVNLTGRIVDVETLDWVVSHSESLQSISLYGSPLGRDVLADFALAHPQVRIYREAVINGETIDKNVTELDLSGQTLVYEEIAAELGALEFLEKVDLTGCSLSETEKRALSDMLGGVEMVWVMDLFGYEVPTDSEKLKIVDAEIGTADELIAALKYFPHLRYIDLTNCTLSDADLDRVRDTYPEKGIVWTVHVGIYSIRTDATAFSTFHVNGTEPYYYSEDFQVLRYCEDLVALDIGHNHVKDLTWLEDMPQLKVLILVDNDISDISSLAALTNLEYLELFVNTITDISPLAGLDKLIDLNLGFNNFSNIEPLLGLTGLERLWLTNNLISYADILRLEEALPNTHIDYTAKTSVEGGWRVHERYNIIFEMFKNGYYIDWEWNEYK